MMSKYKSFCRIVVAALLLTTSEMNAQQNDTRLGKTEQSIVAISSLTAVGDIATLNEELAAGLDNGLTINEIKEVLVQLYAYCGFPRSLNAINAFSGIVKERQAKGIKDVVGKEIIQNSEKGDKYEQGRTTLEALSKTSQPKPAPGYGEFAPRVDAFLKEHLFADVFSSDVLTFRQRELVTISALASMTGVESQLQSHVRLGLNTGIAQGQLIHAAEIVENKISITQANTLRKALSVPVKAISDSEMLVGIAEIEIFPEFIEEYKGILKEESSKSIEVERGVIAIFPMYRQDKPTQITIVEIYASKAAREEHLKTPHFQHYKATTLKMVKSLKLIGMEELDAETMSSIFRKL